MPWLFCQVWGDSDAEPFPNQPGGVEGLDLGSSSMLNPMETMEEIFENEPPQRKCVHIVIKVPAHVSLPSSKRIYLEELDAAPSKLKSLAEKARNQKSHLRKEYQSLEKLHNQLSDPTLMTTLPFLFLGEGKPTDRFMILDDDSGSYIG
ncbi:hypothetical protein L211DRAFT_853920 [Terfezia boudieri ATCC MYA-4762]|uniref:Uncharacterized protein n=1 Tax=Terfezia boudieri ATCC MYA-4762 TaxID=1051890 RepID=A0A3N4LA91_9PEZI|nr:hypothetical protein L211DRAFT_853920 [Terfezia boudieri ATCC MYA-4762]